MALALEEAPGRLALGKPVAIVDIGSNSMSASTNFTIGVAANPGVPEIENELRLFAYKVEAGAEYAITQAVFDLRLLEEFLVGKIQTNVIETTRGLEKYMAERDRSR